MDNIDRDILKENGWALGKFFTSNTAQALINLIPEKHQTEGHVFIAITHDCSVISPSLKNEPLLEYLSVQPIEKENGQFVNARNIRRLHFQVEVNGEPKWFEATMGKRGFICRSALQESQPDERYFLQNDSKAILKRWLANRYISQTFPDRFNELTGNLVANSKSPLIKAFNTDIGKACHSIFISLTPEGDIEEHECYMAVIALLFRDEIAEEIGRETIEEFGEDIKAIIASIEKIDPVEVYALADSDVTYSQISKMSRWQLDYVSIKDGTEILAVDHS